MPAYSWDRLRGCFVKECPKCGRLYHGDVTQSETERILSIHFAQDRATADGFYGTCRECVSLYMQSKRDGRNCDPHQMLKDQNGLCGICKREIALNKGHGTKVPAYVDHNHETGTVRELLCHRCNSILGVVEDKEWMQKAIAYLEKHNENN